jgi:predicted DNA-binding ribbon-helix-helix protein
MCHFFANQHPESYAFETRSIRLNGQSTPASRRPIHGRIIEQIARDQGMSVPRFISTLHGEVLNLWGEVANFTSHLRCICIVALENGPGATLDRRQVGLTDVA